MPTVVQFRRGTTAQNNNFTGAVGEISYDTEVDTLRVHDGSTAGGFELVNTISQQNISNKNFANFSVSDNTVTAGDGGTNVTIASPVQVDQWAHNSAPAAIEYTVFADDNTAGESQVSKYVLTYDASTIAASEYAVTYTGASSLGSLSSSVDGTNISLFFTRTGSNTVAVKVFKTVIQ